jgi:hypothetical protein
MIGTQFCPTVGLLCSYMWLASFDLQLAEWFRFLFIWYTKLAIKLIIFKASLQIRKFCVHMSHIFKTLGFAWCPFYQKLPYLKCFENFGLFFKNGRKYSLNLICKFLPVWTIKIYELVNTSGHILFVSVSDWSLVWAFIIEICWFGRQL